MEPESAGDGEHWTAYAREWIAWARAPNFDAFWGYRGAFAGFFGRGSGEALDVGCGEGRVSREVRALGYRVSAVDAVAELIAAAREMDSADAYAVAPATALPFEDDRFDLVVAYNMLMDVDDLAGTLAEIARVLHPDGRLIVSIVHPFADRGGFSSNAPDAAFVLRGSYFGRQRFEGVDERNGLTMHFAGWSQPLEAYADHLGRAGFAITSLREPRPDTGEGREHLTQWSRVPLFLWIEARLRAR